MSLVFNALCPYLLFRFLEPRFPAESILPLLYATSIPLIGFFFGLLLKRTVDAIALMALFGIMFHMAITVLSPSVSMALVLRSFQGDYWIVFPRIGGHQVANFLLRRSAVPGRGQQEGCSWPCVSGSSSQTAFTPP